MAKRWCAQFKAQGRANHYAVSGVHPGTGTDGTAGLRAIKAEAGTVFVQDPNSTRYDGMPRSAIDSGCIDFVLPPQVRFEGQPGEQWTMFFTDPSGNPIEVKGFRSLATVYDA